MGSETPPTLSPSAVRSTAAGLRAWIASGVCQSESGAFVAWVDFANGRLSYDYPEITGYALTFLASQASLSDDECSVGHRAAAWLVDRVRPPIVRPPCAGRAIRRGRTRARKRPR